MLAVALPQIGRNTLTHSRIACSRTCQRKEWFRYEIGIAPARTAKPLRMGTAIHAGIEAWMNGASEGEAIATATAGYQALPGWCKTDDDRDEWECEAEIVRRMLAGYFWRWSDSPLRSEGAEQVFVLPIINPETGHKARILNIAGKTDGRLTLEDGRKAIRETKTVGQDISPESDYWKRLRMDAQISLYLHAERRNGFDAQAVLYDAIRKPEIRPRKISKTDSTRFYVTGLWFGEQFEKNQTLERETPAMFGARLNADIAERPDYYFQRIEIARLESDMQEFERELWDEQQALQARRKRGIWPRNTAACLAMGRCPYLDLCVSGWTPEQGMPAGYTITDEVHPELVTGENTQ